MRLSQALDQAVKLGIVVRNVADAVTPPRVESKEMRVWSQEQGRRFLAVAGQSTYGPIWIVAMATGMRRSELLGLRWEDVDFERRGLRVQQVVTVVRGAPHVGPPKSRSSRREVLVPSEVMDALRTHRSRQNEQRLALGAIWEDHDLVFAAANGNYINPNNLTRDFTRLIALAGLPTIRIHDLRHAHVALLIQLGADIKDVSERVGHARTSTTMDIYHHVMPEQRNETVDKLRGALFQRPEQPMLDSQIP
jgi:integrase